MTVEDSAHKFNANEVRDFGFKGVGLGIWGFGVYRGSGFRSSGLGFRVCPRGGSCRVSASFRV